MYFQAALKVSGNDGLKQFHAGGRPPITPRTRPVPAPKANIICVKLSTNTPIENGTVIPCNISTTIPKANKEPIKPVILDSTIRLNSIFHRLNPIA